MKLKPEAAEGASTEFSIFSFPAPISLVGLTTISPNNPEEVDVASAAGVGANTGAPRKSAAGYDTAGARAGGATEGAAGAGAGAADFTFIPPNKLALSAGGAGGA